MGNRKQKWTSDEEEALRAGVAKHGAGQWKKIEKDPEFFPRFNSRSNIDLKDKWRNLSMSDSMQGLRDKSRTTKPKVGMIVPATQTCPTAVVQDTPVKPAQDDLSKSYLGGKTACKPKYTSMIFEALSALKDPNGSDSSAILKFIEQKYDVPQNFRRLLSSSLRKLFLRGKLEKVQNGFKIKDDFLLGTQTPSRKQKEILAGPSKSPCHQPFTESAKEASLMAAYKIAEAENKSFLAVKSIEEAERISRMAEHAHSLLEVAEAIFEKCKAENPPSPISCSFLESHFLPLMT